MASAAEIKGQILAAIVGVQIIVRYAVLLDAAPQRIDGVLAVAAKVYVPAHEDSTAHVHPGRQVRPVQGAVWRPCDNVAGVSISHPPIIAVDALILAARVKAHFVVVGPLSLAGQHPHRFGDLHGQPVKRAVIRQRQFLRHIFSRPLLRVLDAAGDGIFAAAPAILQIVVAKDFTHALGYGAFSLAGLTTIVDQPIEIIFLQGFAFAVQRFHA